MASIESPVARLADAPLHAHLRAHARRTPDRVAYLWYGAEITFGQLDAWSDGFAARLAELGVKQGEPVALFLNNCPQYVVAHYGIQKLGAIVCPCGPLYKEHELGYQLNDLSARVIVAAANLLPVLDKVRAGTPALQHVFVTRHAALLPAVPALDLPPDLAADFKDRQAAVPEGNLDFMQACRSGAVPPLVSINIDEDIALMTYTSGTTGLPKGAMLTFRNALYKTKVSVESRDIDAHDVLLAVAPLYHIAGMLMGVNLGIYSGATCVLLHRFDPKAVLQAIDRHRVTWWYSIAPMNVAVMAVPDAKRTYDLSSLRENTVTSFGITYTQALAEQWQAFAPNCRSMEAAYGLSETHTMDSSMPPGAVRWGTHGKAVPGNEIRILDPDSGAGMPAGEHGEIVLKSAGVFKGYWNKPEATAQTLRNGWVHTGDIGKIDADGYLTFIGRFKEMIKVSGYSVFPEEVETILIKHPQIAQAAVIGVPDPEKGEVVKAFIVKKPGAEAIDAAAVIAWSREHMASYKAPREVAFIDALPATGAGKVLRRLLKDQQATQA
ncbi:MAG: AMP-binding protein [Burkholderiaceae bacterium]